MTKTQQQEKVPSTYWKYTLHNLIGHPLSEVLHLLGLQKPSDYVHDVLFKVT